MSTVAHADALLATLTGAGVNVYESSTAPSTAHPPYAVVYPDPGREENYRLGGKTRTGAYRAAVIVVGSTENNARVIADDVIAALKGVRLDVAGRRCTPCRRESSTPIKLDDPDVPGVYSGTLVWTFVSTPAA